MDSKTGFSPFFCSFPGLWKDNTYFKEKLNLNEPCSIPIVKSKGALSFWNLIESKRGKWYSFGGRGGGSEAAGWNTMGSESVLNYNFKSRA